MFQVKYGRFADDNAVILTSRLRWQDYEPEETEADTAAWLEIGKWYEGCYAEVYPQNGLYHLRFNGRNEQLAGRAVASRCWPEPVSALEQAERGLRAACAADFKEWLKRKQASDYRQRLIDRDNAMLAELRLAAGV